MPGFAATILRETPGLLEGGNYEAVISRARAEHVSPAAARFVLELWRDIRAQPLAVNQDRLAGLHEILEMHPGFACECKAIRDLLDGCSGLDCSYLKEHLA